MDWDDEENWFEIEKCEEFLETVSDSFVPAEIYNALVDYLDSMRPTIRYADFVEQLYEETMTYARNLWDR